MTVVRSGVIAVLLGTLLALGTGLGGWAHDEETAAASAVGSGGQDQLFQPLSPWAMAVFVWLVLFLAMAFIVAVAVLSRPRRY